MKVAPFTKTYEGRCVLDFPGFTFTPGKIYAVIGANGSGKSTFGKILCGILSPDKKSALIKKGTVGYMPQKNYAFRMSTQRNLRLVNQQENLVHSLMQALQIDHLASKRADRLSGGETARMALARLMMRTFDLVVLDEPTAAMDMETSLLSEALIQQYVQRTNCALIIITHSLQQARRIADDVLYFHKGNLLESGPAGLVLTSPAKDETKRFLDFYGI